MTTREEISQWFDRGVNDKATHLLVVCDTFDYEDYPVFVAEGENVRKVFEEYNNHKMQRVMEVYSLSQPKEEQLAEFRCFRFDVAPKPVPVSPAKLRLVK